MVMKRGRYSSYELQFIKDNAPHMTYVDIAKELNREADSVRGIIEGLGLEINLAKGATKAAPSLRSRDFWPLLKQQFTTTEQDYIESQWEKIYKQFNDDVTATEEMQIIDTIKLDVLMHRCLADREMSRRDIEDLRKQMSDLDDEDKALTFSLRTQIGALTQAQTVCTKEYKELQNEKNKILKEMKSTRADRYNKIEASSESIKAWMAELITDDEKREELGRHMEKIRLASLDEEIRLAAWHKYGDGFVDQPLLTPTTVKEGHEIT